jgi:hypothetical protein
MIMSEYKDEAIELLQESTEKLGKLFSKICQESLNGETDKNIYLLREIITELEVKTSQFSGEVKTVEGKCVVDNLCGCVVVGGIPMRDKMQFEVEIDGEWHKGHRNHSQYGEVFCEPSGNVLVILTSDYNGRVTFPLTYDE